MKINEDPYIPIEPEINGYVRQDEPDLSEFSSYSYKDKPTKEDLLYLINWKNKVIELRDSNNGKFLYDVFDDEAKRIIVFLNKFSE